MDLSTLVPASPPVIDDLLVAHRDRPGGLLPLLHAVQERCGYVPPDVVPAIAQAFNQSRAEIHGVITYYHFFRSAPAGRHVVQVCVAESCKSVGGDALMAHAEERLGCKSHQTRADGAVTLEPIYCLGLCAMSPAMLIDDQPYARLSPTRFDRIADRLEIAA